MVAMPGIPLAEVGEVEPAMHIKDDVVRRRQLVAVDLGVQRLRLTGFGVDPLDVAELVVRVRRNAHRVALDILAAAVVAQIQRAVRPKGQPIRPAAATGKHTGFAVRFDLRELVVADFRQDHRSVRAHHWSFRETESGRQDLNVTHGISPFFAARPIRRGIATPGPHRPLQRCMAVWPE